MYTSGFELAHQQAEGLILSGTPTFATDRVRTGARSLKIDAGVLEYVLLNLTFVSGRDYWIRDYFQFDALPGANPQLIFGVQQGGGSGWVELRVDSSGDLSLESQAGAIANGVASLVPDTWYKVSMRIRFNAAGNEEYEVKVDDTIVLATATQATITTAWAQVFIGMNAGSATGVSASWHDDFAINDDQGADQNTWPGAGSVHYLFPAADPGTSSANWQKPGGATTNRHTSLDSPPPIYETYDSTSGSAEQYLRNAATGANAALLLNTGSYDSIIPPTDSIALMQLIAETGSSSATDTAGDFGVSANPVIAQEAFAAFDNGVASGTVTTWPRRAGIVVYDPVVTRSNPATLQIRKVTSTTRVAIVNALVLIVESVPSTGTEYLDAATALLTLTPSAVEIKDSIDAATATLKLTPAGTDVLYETFEFTEAGLPQESCEIGPWKAPNGSFYCVFPHPTNRNQLQVFKASDPTSAWSRAGDYIIAGLASGSVGIAAKLEGTTIHIAHCLINSGVAYHAFDTTTDTWDIVDERVNTGKASGFFAGIGLGIRSDGDIIILYTAEETPASGFCEAYYSRREGGVWTREILVADENTHVGSAGSINVGTIATGASDRLFLIYTDTAVGLCCRSLSSANVLGTATVLSATTAGDQICGASFNHTSNTKVGVLHANGAGNLVVTEWDDAATPVPTTTTISDNAVAVDDGPLAGVAVNGSDRHTVFTDSATSDVFYDKNTGSGWGTDQEIHDAVTANKISANVYEHNGTVLAYIWKNGAVPEYDEVVLATIYTDSATAILALVPSATENAQLTDSATLPLALTPSAVEIREQFDAATALLVLSPSGTDELSREYTDTATATVLLSPSAIEIREQFDAATVLLDLQPSGTDVAEFADTAIVPVLFTPSGTEARDILDAATISVALTPSSTDIAAYIDSDTTLFVLTPSGTEAAQGESSDAGTLNLLLQPSSSDIADYLDSAVSQLLLSPFAADVTDYVDSALASLLLIPSSTDLTDFIDSATPVVVLTPSAVETYISGSNIDADTVYLRLIPTTIVEIRFIFDTLLAATVYQRYSFGVQQVWSGTMTSKWFGIMLNRIWSANVAGTKWSAALSQKWQTIYKGRG